MKILKIFALGFLIGNVGCKSTSNSSNQQESLLKTDGLGEKLCEISVSKHNKISLVLVSVRDKISNVISELEAKIIENPLAVDLMRTYTKCVGGDVELTKEQISHLLTEVDLNSNIITAPLQQASDRLKQYCPLRANPPPISVTTTSSYPTLGTFNITFKSNKFKCPYAGFTGLMPCISGTADFYDYWDFNKADRSLVPETLTTLARTFIPGTPFVVEGKDIPFRFQNGVLTLHPEATPCQ